MATGDEKVSKEKEKGSPHNALKMQDITGIIQKEISMS